MQTMADCALRMCAFSAAAGCMEMLMPEGKTKNAAMTLLGLLSAAMLADMAARLMHMA